MSSLRDIQGTMYGFFGSNATPMGGSAGRGDAMIAAVEAQKAEGVLHIHAFVYFQTASQFRTLLELGKQLQQGMISGTAMKEYISYTRCASYPDISQFIAERNDIEEQWPAYSDDLTLSRLPAFFWTERCATSWIWKARYEERLQHCLSRMNHHIHPLVDGGGGERRPLPSCLSKGKKTCKSDYPLDNLLCEAPLLVCRCIAAERCLPTTGPRSVLGTVLPARNNEWLNAGPRALVAFTGSNADIKFPHRLPILPESHEVLLYDAKRANCCRPGDLRAQACDLQAGMAAAAGYFGGCTSKKQDIGEKVLKRLSATLTRTQAGAAK